VNVEILADHYQKTSELTVELWKQRNQIFLILLAVIGAGTILTFSPTTTNPLLVRWIAKSLGVADRQDVQDLGNSFPFGLLQSLVLVVVFYLVVNLYHRSLYVLRNYRYLAALESEIRQHLAVDKRAIAFTREGAFYWNDRSPLQSAVKWCYIVLVGSLLFAFLGGRIFEDLRTHPLALAAVDVLLAIPTALFFLAYARSSVSLDSAENMLCTKH
jgi:hypothetical protein